MNLQYINEFGFRLFFINSATRIMRKLKFSDNKISSYTNFKHNADEKYLYKHYKDCITCDEFCEEPNYNSPKRIYVFWWDGEENAPKLVKKCIDSIKEQNELEVVCLTKDNFDKYVNLPDYIIEKAKKGTIGLAHFSDVLRFALLYKNGGVWIDATCLQTAPLPNEIFDYSFFSLKGPFVGKNSLGWQWTSFYMSAQAGDIVCKKMLQFYYKYWKEHNCANTYLILDCYMTVLYEHDNAVKDEIDSLPKTDKGIFELIEVLNDNYDKDKLHNIYNKSYLHKLTYKIDFQASKNGALTNWGYISNNENINAC